VDGGEARSELWRRYDAGTIDADELEARLRMVDHAALGDADEVRRAVDGIVPIRRRRSTRKAVVLTLGVLGVMAIAGGVVTVAASGDDDGGADINGGFGPVTTAIGILPVPAPAPPPPDCDEFTALLEENGGQFGFPDLPANPVLLTDPPYLPAGYERTSEDDIVPGTDPDIAMSTAAGNPLPIEILGRSLDGGEFPVRMRAFVFDSVETAQQNSRDLARNGLCNFDGERFSVEGRPELFGSVVTGVIPTTAFVSFTLGDRRVIVAAEAGAGDVEGARRIAGEIAGAELDAARTAPPPG
jgi:hypothetical protein